MKKNDFLKLLKDVKNGTYTPEEALEKINRIPFESLEFATIDHHRLLRMGFPEVILCEGKEDSEILTILGKIIGSGSNILATRANREIFKKAQRKFPDLQYNERGRVIYLKRDEGIRGKGPIAVITAGTSDIPVAEEAAITSEVMGNEVIRLYDVGVAGIHRLFLKREEILKASVHIVIAGMEGALASVVGGLVSKLVIAVPTSRGYGASFGGLSALLTMLNSCAAGVVVVNIDNGFGAGYSASIVNRKEKE
jgi:NCAIR mutase (PurE)-related protein